MRAVPVTRVLALGLCIATLLSVPAEAAPPARGDHAGWTDGQGIGATVTSPGEEKAATTRRAGGVRRCSYAPLSPEDAMVADFLLTHDQDRPPHSDGGAWYSKTCVDEQGNPTATVAWYWQPPASPANGQALAEQVLRYMPLPLPSMAMNPPADRDQLVNLPVWLWVDPASWKPVSTSASAGGVTVTVQAEPVRVVWTMGDGGTVTCGPGTPYDPARQLDTQSSPCSYAYRHPSVSMPGGRYPVTATAEWHATWTVAGDPTSGGDLGVVTRSSTTTLRVAEAQAVNTVPAP